MKRNDKKIFDKLIIKGAKVTSREVVVLEFPEAYEGKRLLIVTAEKTLMIAICKIEIGNTYGVMLAPALIAIGPASSELVDRDGVTYVRRTYAPGTPIISDLNNLVNGDPVYEILNMMSFRGKMPYFVLPNDTNRIFDDAKRYTGVPVDAAPAANELIWSMCIRDGKKIVTPFRMGKSGTYKYIATANVSFGAATTFTKTLGNYQKAGLLDSLVTNEAPTNKVETILRS